MISRMLQSDLWAFELRDLKKTNFCEKDDNFYLVKLAMTTFIFNFKILFSFLLLVSLNSITVFLFSPLTRFFCFAYSKETVCILFSYIFLDPLISLFLALFWVI